jgi:HAD superfamily hydrolase (TIGR01509 family)
MLALPLRCRPSVSVGRKLRQVALFAYCPVTQGCENRRKVGRITERLIGCAGSAPRALSAIMKALIFDLDGTLVDTVYGHALSWQRALSDAGIAIDTARLHRRIGMAGELLMEAAAREAGVTMSRLEMKATDKRHAKLFSQLVPKPRPLSGAVRLLQRLRQGRINHGIATSGKRQDIQPAITALKLPRRAVVVDGSSAKQAKPEPDLFLQCQARLGAAKQDCFVVGDATWDMLAARRAGMLSVGLLSGGFGEDELYRAGAFRVYQDPDELLHSLLHLGIYL